MGQTTLRAILGVQPAEWSNPLSAAGVVAKADSLDPAELMIFAAASMQVDEALGNRLLEAERELSEGRLREAQVQLAEILRGAPADQATGSLHTRPNTLWRNGPSRWADSSSLKTKNRSDPNRKRGSRAC